jgi:PAT family beta-lactamase induction signal transducer AmpG
MRICDREHAAVQYATLTGLYALPGTLAGAVSGIGAEALGYAGLFAATALVAAPAFAFLPAARRWIDDDGHAARLTRASRPEPPPDSPRSRAP